MRAPALIAQCVTCHGADGNSHIEYVPFLAGQQEFFPRTPSRSSARGCARSSPWPARRWRGERLSEWLHYGSRHMPSLAGKEQMPRLAGQRVNYPYVAMTALRDNQRHAPSLRCEPQLPSTIRVRLRAGRDPAQEQPMRQGSGRSR